MRLYDKLLFFFFMCGCRTNFYFSCVVVFLWGNVGPDREKIILNLCIYLFCWNKSFHSCHFSFLQRCKTCCKLYFLWGNVGPDREKIILNLCIFLFCWNKSFHSCHFSFLQRCKTCRYFIRLLMSETKVSLCFARGTVAATDW